MEVQRKVLKRNERGCIQKYVYLIDGKPVPRGKKYCPACDKIKDKKIDFTAKGNACKGCANKRARKHHKRRMKDPEHVAKRRLHYRMRARNMKRKIVEFLGRKCSECSGVFPDAVYDLHHTNPENKMGNISNILGLSWKSVIRELKKCVLLCANCHRIKTFSRCYSLIPI